MAKLKRETMGKEKEVSKNKSGLVKGPSWFYFAASGLLYLLAVYFFAGAKVPLSDLSLFAFMTVINFTILGYSFRLKKLKSRKHVLTGAILLLAGFVFYYLLNIYEAVQSLSAILSLCFDLSITAGYLFLLFGLQETMK